MIPVGATEPIPVDVRIIAATIATWRKKSDEEFRADLFYRLNVIALELPALRDRKDDLLLLMDSFCRTCPRIAVAKSRHSPRKRWTPSWYTTGPATS